MADEWEATSSSFPLFYFLLVRNWRGVSDPNGDRPKIEVKVGLHISSPFNHHPCSSKDAFRSSFENCNIGNATWGSAESSYSDTAPHCELENRRSKFCHDSYLLGIFHEKKRQRYPLLCWPVELHFASNVSFELCPALSTLNWQSKHLPDHPKSIN